MKFSPILANLVTLAATGLAAPEAAAAVVAKDNLVRLLEDHQDSGCFSLLVPSIPMSPSL